MDSMSPLRDLQLAGRELGRIRIGAMVTFTRDDGTSGKRPSKLEAFRFTTPSERNARLIAEHFGGTAEPWLERPGQWQVMTTAREIPVMIPPGHPLTQHYELWSGGGIKRRCDGFTQENGAKCVCPNDISARQAEAARGAACKPMSRLSVAIPDLLDLGVWMIVSGGYNAAHELAGSAEFLERAARSDVFLPAILRLEPRTSIKDGKTHSYGVPVLEVGASLRALTSGDYDADGPMMLPPPPGVRALEAGHQQPPPPAAEQPPFARLAAPADDDDPNVIDAEVIPDATDIAEKSPGCMTRHDVEVLGDEANRHKLSGQEVTDPITGARVILRDLLTRRWKELPA